jgi:DNA mismatch repair protein MutS
MSDTPMMRQYQEAKAACPDALLLFRMGDFYELFHDDARTAARVLHLTLTSREKGENAIPMAGFPYHQLENYLAKLIQAGFRAAICEQVEDPKQAKGLVRREVTRVVTPGTLVEDALLDPAECNYLAAVAPGDPAGLAWIELSTGRFQACDVPAARLADELARIAPAELLWPEGHEPPAGDRWRTTLRPAWSFGAAAAAETKASASTIRTAPPCGRPGRRSPIWARHNGRRSSTSSGSNPTRRATCCRSTPPPAAAWRSREPCAKGGARGRCWR